MRNYSIVFVFGFLLWSLGAVAQISASAVLDNNQLLLGDQVQLHLRLSEGAGVTVQSTDLSELQAIEEIEILAETEWDTLQTDRGLLFEKNITLTSFDSGYYYIPEVEIQYTQAGQKGTVKTPVLALSVGTIPPSEEVVLAPIKGIIHEGRSWQDFLPFIGGLLFWVLLIWGIRYFWRRSNNQSEDALAADLLKPKRPAHEVALEQLSDLQEKSLWQTGAVKAYHSELTHIVREYLENRYDVQALESTTDEILKQLGKLDFDGNWKAKLREMLQAADLVKFAKAEPPADFHASMWNYAEAFVEDTKFIKIEEPTEEEGEEPTATTVE